MLPYWLMFLVFAFGAVQGGRRLVTAGATAKSVNDERTPLLAMAAVIPIVLIGLRYEVGGDWFAYEQIFVYTRFQGQFGSMKVTEPAYALLNWLAAEFGFGIWFVNTICGAIFTAGLLRFAKQQPNPWLAIAVAVPYLVIVVAMGYTRQGVAIGCVMFSLAALSNGSFFRFAVWVMVAAMFHRTALVLIPIVGFAYTRNRLQSSIVVIGAVLFGYYVLLPAAMESYSASYLENAYEAQGAGVRLAMNALPAIIFLLFSRRFGLEPLETKVWRMLALTALGCAALYFGLASSVIADRLGLYVIPLQLLVFSRLPYAFGSNGQPSFPLLIIAVAYSAAVQFVWLNYAGHATYWVPYKFFPLW